MATDSPSHRATVEEYLRLGSSDPTKKYEYYDGYIRLLVGGRPEHAIVSAAIIGTLFAALRGSPCVAFTSDARVQISAAHYVYPDVTISCDKEDRTSADLSIHSQRVVIEVLSPSTQLFDRKQKSDYYRACPSIQEIVLVSSDEPRVELFRRAEPFWQFASYGLGDTLTLASIDVTLPIAEFYRDIEFPPQPIEPHG